MTAFVSVGDTITVIAPAPEGSIFTRWFSRVSYWQLSSFVLTVAGFVFCATATGVAWRVWYIDNDATIGSGVLSIGIWEVCFSQRKKVNQNHDLSQCWPFTEEHTTIPKAMLIAQDLMIFVNLLDISIIGLMSFVLWNVLKSKNPQVFLVTFFSVAASLNFISAALLLVPSVWNTRSILLSEDISFPPEFRLPKSPNDQDIGVAIYLAYCALILKFLSGVLVVWENSLLKFKKNNPPNKVGPHSGEPRKSVSQNLCPRCGSSIDLNDFGLIADWYSDVQFSEILKASSAESQVIEHQIIEIPEEIPLPEEIAKPPEIPKAPQIPTSVEIPIPEEIPTPPDIPIPHKSTT